MDIKKLIMLCITSIMFIPLSTIAYAQEDKQPSETEYVEWKNDDVIIYLIPKSQKTIELYEIKNNKDYPIFVEVYIKGDNSGSEILWQDTISHGDSKKFNALECNEIEYKQGNYGGGGTLINDYNIRTRIWEKYQESIKTVSNESVAESAIKQYEHNKETKPQSRAEKKQPSTISSKKIVEQFNKHLSSDDFYSSTHLNKAETKIDEHIGNIQGWLDKNQYIEDKNLRDFIDKELSEIESHREGIDAYINQYLSQYKDYKIELAFDHQDSMRRILLQRVEQYEDNINRLKAEIDSAVNAKSFDIAQIDKKKLIAIGGVALIVAILGLCVIVRSKRKKSSVSVPLEVDKPQPVNDASSAIVIRKATTTILKKQNIDSVVNNMAYFKIDTSEFCDDSAVANIYIKNTCIKDIYNMYADDLRNPNNPKEDGCMVLGRWVLDEVTNKYSVSLEEIVRPGDDAIFKEYELNFGGKIKLRVAERLRKLRNETNLQYDLTCWVHSHPGLGVFFSNFDTSVQTQLKHSTHPNFLVAIVVDILTPQQEFGIFTYKKDSSISSRNDLKKMYSLEALHKWAVESDRNSYKMEDCYNILAQAKSLNHDCQGVQLSNGAIIDISSLTTEQNSGLIGWMHGFRTECNGKVEYVVNTVSKDERTIDNELLGCLITGTHRSIPSIKRAISDHIEKIKFVAFYSEKEGILTTIPVVDKQLMMEEEYYSEETLEDLKIWTRRKR